MSDRLISDIDPAELADAVIAALRDAGIDYCEFSNDGEEVNIDGILPLVQIGSHLKRMLMMDPPAAADRITAAEKD